VAACGAGTFKVEQGEEPCKVCPEGHVSNTIVKMTGRFIGSEDILIDKLTSHYDSGTDTFTIPTQSGGDYPLSSGDAPDYHSLTPTSVYDDIYMEYMYVIISELAELN
jgi:hypothetical protein